VTTWSVNPVYSTDIPKRCQVPEITSDFDTDGAPLWNVNADTGAKEPLVEGEAVADPRVVRPAVTYFTASGADPGLPAESEDGTSMWTRKVVLADATTAEGAESSSAATGSLSRTKAGEVAWHTGNVVAAKFVEKQRERESAFYTTINVARAAALATATSMAGDDAWPQPDTLVAPFLNNAADTDIMTASAAGANKALKEAKDARDHATTGAGISMPSTRTQSSTAGEEWKWTWAALTFGQMNTWKTNNASAGASYQWFTAAKAVTAAVDNWWTAYGNGASDVDDETEEVKWDNNNTPTSTSCDTTGWSADVDATDIAECKAACVNLKVDLFNADLDTTDPDVDNGGTTFAKYRDGTDPAVAVTTWCGAYSWHNGGGTGQKCYTRIGDDTAAAVTTDNADS
jgi:hypothetical protein